MPNIDKPNIEKALFKRDNEKEYLFKGGAHYGL
jgi:hypothetical protein